MLIFLPFSFLNAKLSLPGLQNLQMSMIDFLVKLVESQGDPTLVESVLFSLTICSSLFSE